MPTTLIYHVDIHLPDQDAARRYWVGVNAELGSAVIDTDFVAVDDPPPDEIETRMDLAMRLMNRTPLPTSATDLSDDEIAEIESLSSFSMVGLCARWVGEWRPVSVTPIDIAEPHLNGLISWAVQALAAVHPAWQSFLVEQKTHPTPEA